MTTATPRTRTYEPAAETALTRRDYASTAHATAGAEAVSVRPFPYPSPAYVAAAAVDLAGMYSFRGHALWHTHLQGFGDVA